ncbi:hypothetical protein SAMN05443662_0483 [Sulfurivirga caldicuralii]|uniref:Uncharacterized protein n=1 Tax=Sulfurivirga caldicuralii TaxID=364032 RepID=A0A1N6DY79_9GAMM|nr:hypothetical protein [Sulfurivirga caldicuralii]SIN75702.1 hypothetical protein SAMN05443662_0483 [Sulfurivirga caldicuralii]
MNMQTTQGLKLKACLNDLNARHQYEQAMLLEVLDTIVQDIHSLNRLYTVALKKEQLRLYIEETRQVHQKWINMLQELVSAQVSNDTIDYLIDKMQQYAEQLIKMPTATIEPVSSLEDNRGEEEENAASVQTDATQPGKEYAFPVLQSKYTPSTSTLEAEAAKIAHAC